MAADRSLALPVSIVTGSVIIGLFAYFGLRDGLRPAPTPVATPTAPTAPAEPAKGYVRKPAEPVPDRVFRQAQAALDAQRPGFIEKCWTPPAAGEPASVLLTYDVTFDAAGKIIAIGLSEHREAYRRSVADCVRTLPYPVLPVDPPGENVRVIVALPMP